MVDVIRVYKAVEDAEGGVLDEVSNGNDAIGDK
jgi:hypothetical protein